MCLCEWFLCPPSPRDHKMSRALCHCLCVGVHKHLVSVNYRTITCVDWSDFSVAYWEWLEEGSFRWSAPPLIQDGHHLGFGFRRFSDHAWVDWSDFFVALWGSLRKVPFDVQRRCSSNMAAMAAILDLVSVIIWRMPASTGRIFSWLIGGLFHFSLNLIFHTPTDNFPLALCCPCSQMPCALGSEDDLLWLIILKLQISNDDTFQLSVSDIIDFTSILCERWCRMLF
jgi:hypothetical protein